MPNAEARFESELFLEEGKGKPDGHDSVLLQPLKLPEGQCLRVGQCLRNTASESKQPVASLAGQRGLDEGILQENALSSRTHVKKHGGAQTTECHRHGSWKLAQKIVSSWIP